MGVVKAVRSLLAAGANANALLPGGKTLQDVVRHNLAVHAAATTPNDREKAVAYQEILVLLKQAK